MDFKVGDKVRIISDKSDIKQFTGKETVISEINVIHGGTKEYKTPLHNYIYFISNEMELIEAKKDNKQNYFEKLGKETGNLVDKKQKAYGDSVAKTYQLMQIFLQNYENEDNTYTIPKSLLKHILLQVRIIDKQNRIFNNPDGDLMSENPYIDTVGYGMLGHRMCEKE